MSEKAGRRKPNPENTEPDRERAAERALFARYQADPTPELEELLIEKYRSLVYKIVHKFHHTPDMFEDLVKRAPRVCCWRSVAST